MDRLERSVVFGCPVCGQQVRVDVEYTGKTVTCRGCHRTYDIPVEWRDYLARFRTLSRELSF